MRELVECEIDEHGIVRRPAAGTPARAKRRSVTVNLTESPLGWLAARGLVDRRQAEAGERLRADYEAASIAPRTTMRWEARVDRSHAGEASPGGPTLSAKRRFDAAIAAVGPGLSDIAWRVVCAGEGVPAAERALGWPARGGRLVLTLALDRLAAHYRLP